MTPVVHTDISTKEICHKKGFLVNLFAPSFNVGKQTFMEKMFSSQFHSLLSTFFFNSYSLQTFTYRSRQKRCEVCQLHKMSSHFTPSVVPNAQNRALKKWKLDSNPRCGPGSA